MSIIKIAGSIFGLIMLAGAFSDKSHSVVTTQSPANNGSTAVQVSSCTVDAAGYSKLQTNDSYSIAAYKLGCAGSEMSRSEMAGYSTVMYTWQGKGLGANMNAMFQNDRLVSKAQFGL